jgi:hypothetical protein
MNRKLSLRPVPMLPIDSLDTYPNDWGYSSTLVNQCKENLRLQNESCMLAPSGFFTLSTGRLSYGTLWRGAYRDGAQMRVFDV